VPDAEYHHVWQRRHRIGTTVARIIARLATTRPRRPHPLACLDHDDGVEASSGGVGADEHHRQAVAAGQTLPRP